MTPTNVFYIFGFVFIIKMIECFIDTIRNTGGKTDNELKQVIKGLNKIDTSDKAKEALGNVISMPKREGFTALTAFVSFVWVIGGFFSYHTYPFTLLLSLGIIDGISFVSKHERKISFVTQPLQFFIASFILFQYFFL